MSVEQPYEVPQAPPGVNGDAEELEEDEVISVEITEENLVLVHGEEWELLLSPEEARELGQALLEAAADAESPEEE